MVVVVKSGKVLFISKYGIEVAAILLSGDILKNLK